MDRADPFATLNPLAWASSIGRMPVVPWVIGGGLLYLVLLVTLGVTCFTKGHWVLFVIGIVFPFLWLVGAVMPRAPMRAR
jgi:hypothetical protein